MKVSFLIFSFVIIGCYSLPIDERPNVNNIDVNDILTNIPDNFEVNEEISGILKRIGDIIFNQVLNYYFKNGEIFESNYFLSMQPVNIFDGPLHCPDGTRPSGYVCKPIY